MNSKPSEQHEEKKSKSRNNFFMEFIKKTIIKTIDKNKYT